MPIVERLPELTPGHRVVYELSELQLPTLSRGTTVAVYTNVTADHLDRHGSLEAYRRGQAAPGRARRSRRAPWSSTPRTRSSPAYAGLGARTESCCTGSTARCRVASASSTAGSSPAGVGRLALAGGGAAATGPGRTDPADRRSWRCPARTTSRTRWPPSRSRCCSASRPMPSAGPRQRSPASSTVSSRSRVIDGVRFVNDSQGTQPDAVDRGASRASSADRADRRRPRQGRGPARAGTGRRRARRRGRAHRRERAGRWSGCSARPGSRGPSGPGRSRPPSNAPTRSPARRSQREARPPDPRRSCSAPPPPASTCSRTTPRAVAPSRTPSPRLPPPAPRRPTSRQHARADIDRRTERRISRAH